MSTIQRDADGRTAGMLRDVRFRSRVAPSLLPALYLSVLVIVALAGVSTVVVAAVQHWWLGLIAVLLVPLVGFVLIAVARVGCELVCAVLELNAHVSGIADRLPHLERVIGELAHDMPKLGFLRRGANGRGRAVPDAGNAG